MDQPILAPPSEAGDGRPRQTLPEVRRKGPAKVASTGLDAGDPLSEQHLFQASDRRFDFGKFRHRCDMADHRQGR
jgi:hypothetical protein